MPLYKISGRFADNHTFTVPSIEADGPQEAIDAITSADDVKNYGQDVTLIIARRLGGAPKKIKISDKPAAERKGGRKKATATPAPAPQPANAPAPQPQHQPSKRR